MSAIVLVLLHGGDRDTLIGLVKKGKGFLGKGDAAVVRMAQIYAGPDTGDLLVATRYSSFEAYGKAIGMLTKSDPFMKLMAQVSPFIANRVILSDINL